MQQEVTGTSDSENSWIEHNNWSAELLKRIRCLFSDKTATKHKDTVSFAYTVHAIFLNAFAERSWWLINNGHTLMGFLLVCCFQQQLKEKRIEEEEELLFYGFKSSVKGPSEREYELMQI